MTSILMIAIVLCVIGAMLAGMVIGVFRPYIVIYVIGAMLTGMVIWFFRPYMDGNLALLVTYFWPLALVVIVGRKIRKWLDNRKGGDNV